MSTFDDRKKAEEARQSLRDELRFKAESRRNKLLGLWAAELMGHHDPAAYAAEVVLVALEVPGDDDIAGKIVGDLEKAGKPITHAEFHAKASEYHALAEEQVLTESGKLPPQD